MAIPPFPSFYLIGAPRCANRWLRHNLDQHPDICAPPLDLHYFARPKLIMATNTRWYREQFAWDGEALLGETSPGYLSAYNEPRLVADRLYRARPDARLIAIVRQPVDRLQSAFGQAIRSGELPPADAWDSLPEEALGQVIMRYTRDGGYSVSLRTYRDLFGDQLKIMLYDDLQVDPTTFYVEALTHIGADPSFIPDQLDRVRFASPVGGAGGVDDEEKRTLFDLYRAGIEELSQWTGRDLSSWDPARAA